MTTETATFLLLSLSRLNHWLPRGQAHPEVVQGTAEFHHQITDSLLPQANPVFHDATALHTTIDMLDPEPTLVQGLVRELLLQRQLLATGLLRRHEDLHLGQRERQETQVLQQPAPRRQGIRRRVRNGLIMNWLRVFRSAEAARVGQGGRQQRHTRAVRSEKWGGSVPERRTGMRVIAAFFRSCAPDALTAHVSVFSHYFKRLG